MKDADWARSRRAEVNLAIEIAFLTQQPGNDLLAHGGALALSNILLIDAVLARGRAVASIGLRTVSSGAESGVARLRHPDWC
ncbi:hypothetical protein QFZ24_009963 [Streptomyces phaeochromogenes]|uniref:hypothetical protein n=1 Tax=Streptomyces phaeochromogenes TaxID=1923 RepID=UPI00278E6F3F|nr:hypothetical protein [Streptomyces phaeochromogenes]MDQ0955954.1 hypothetical protein [Streptomyces phaeochromogenes]